LPSCQVTLHSIFALPSRSETTTISSIALADIWPPYLSEPVQSRLDGGDRHYAIAVPEGNEFEVK
jgi:hypothetical protein